MIYKRIILACLFVLLAPALGGAGTVKIAVLPWKVNSAENMDFVKEAMSDMLASRLGSHASVEVARPDLVKGALGAHAGAVTDGAAMDAGRKLAVDYVVYGSLTIFGSTVSLDAKVVNIANGKISPVYSKAEGLDSVVGMAEKISADVLAISGAVAPAAPAEASAPLPSGAVTTGVVGAAPAPEGVKEDGGFIIKPKEGPKPVQWKSAPMDGFHSALSAADLDRDGKKELFIISSSGFTVAVPTGDGIKVVKEFKSPTGYTNVSVAAMDSDGDGAPEVYLSRVYSNRPSSVVVEFKDGEYRETITGVGWLARAARTGAGAPVLIGQRFRDKDGFYGPVVELRKEGGRVVEKGAFEGDLPRGVDLYRFDTFDFTGDGERELVAVDSRNYLRVYRRGDKGGWKEEWKSTEFYGGTLSLVAFSKDDPNGSVYKPVPIEGGFFHADIDKDGKTELIIKRNIPGGLGRWAESPSSFKESEILSLSWDKDGVARVKENWKSQKVEGYMADFIIDDLDGDGTDEITMLIVEETGKLFGKPKTYILSYRVSI